MLFRTFLAQKMAERGRTNAQLADTISQHTGRAIEEPLVSKWLRGRLRPGKEYARAIAFALDVPFEDIWNMLQAERALGTNFSRIAQYLGEDLDLFGIIDENARQLIYNEQRDSNHAQFMRLDPRNTSDLDWILGFDHRIYPTSKPVTRPILQAWLKAENALSFTLKRGSELKAYCTAFPVSDNAFHDLLHGRCHESDLPPSEIGLHHKNHYIYSNMAVGPYYAGHLLARIALVFITHQMQRIGGLVVSHDEERLCQRLEMTRVWIHHSFPGTFKPTTYSGDVAKPGALRDTIKHYHRYLELLQT